MGGQTALNTAMALHRDGRLAKYGVELIGANAEAIDKAEDRLLFREAMTRIGLESPQERGRAQSRGGDAARSTIVGLPAIIRPSFTLGGTGGGIAYNRDEFFEIVQGGLDASPVGEVLVEESVLGWKEYEMEVVRDRARQLHHHLLDRERRSDGHPHRRFGHRGAGADADRQGIPDHAQRLDRVPARDRRRHRRIERAVRGRSRRPAAWS